MESRWARVARGMSAAIFASVVAAVSHTLAGGAAPSVFATIATLVISAPICTLLAGRTLSAGRLSASVALSQALFHGVFSSFGTPVAAAHEHGAALSLSGLPASAHMHDGASMWIAHAVAAAITVVAFLHAERAFWGIAGTARLFLSRLLATVIPVSTLPALPRAIVEVRFLPRDLTLLLCVMRHRGPPKPATA